MEHIPIPKTLLEAVKFYSDPAHCREHMIAVRWPDGVIKCPTCGSENVTFLETANLYKCYGRHDRAKFSLKVGTVFEDSPIGLDKWLPVVWLLANAKNGISSYEIARSIGVTRTASERIGRMRIRSFETHNTGMPELGIKVFFEVSFALLATVAMP
jgi:transposase-like protein